MRTTTRAIRGRVGWVVVPVDESQYLNCVDVSHHQTPGTIDLSDVDVLGVRACYGARPDKHFAAHVADAMRQGVPYIQAYGFFRQHQPADEQLAALRKACEHQPLNMIPCWDYEWNYDPEDHSRWDGPPQRELHNGAGRELCQRTVDVFGECMVYTAPYFWRDVLGSPEWMIARDRWIAHYTGKPGTFARLGDPDFDDGWAAHQYQGAPLDRSVARYVTLLPGREPHK